MIIKALQKLYYKPPVYFVRHFKVRRLKSKSNVIFKEYLSKNVERKLQIGCGNNVLEGWLNTDLLYKKNEVAYLDAGNPFPLPNDTFDYVYSEHIFEHLNFKQGLNMLRECYRILKPGGHLRLATPDMDFLMALHNEPQKAIHQEYIKWSTNRFISDISNNFEENEYLPVFVINNFFRDWGHQVVNNYESLELIFKKAGFSNISRQEVGKSNIKEFDRVEKHGEIIPDEFNELETLVVEAVKQTM
ncbi:MAG: methyltransferase domain-containing protein [Bacteroidales bacterium]|nr:methyltransferase domain-containing protein [Bacteroidales bacterium]